MEGRGRPGRRATHREAFVEVFKRRLPRLYGRLGDSYLTGEGCRGDHVAGTGEKEFRKDADAGDVGNLREVAAFPVNTILAEALEW